MTDISKWRCLLIGCEFDGCGDQVHKEFKDHSGSLLLCAKHADQFEEMMIEEMMIEDMQEYYAARTFGQVMRRLWEDEAPADKDA